MPPSPSRAPRVDLPFVGFMGIRAMVRRWQRVGGWVGLCAAVFLADKLFKQTAELERTAQLAAHLRAEQIELEHVLDEPDAANKNLADATARPAVSSTAELDCVNHHEACADWAAHGQCTANAGYMLATCVLSCNDGCESTRSPASASPAPLISPPPPPSPPAFHLPPAPPREPCVEADRDTLEREWGHNVTDAYKQLTPPASCAGESTVTLQCDELTGLYCQAQNIELELYARGDPHFAIDCAGVSMPLAAKQELGFGFNLKASEQWAEQLTANRLPSFIDRATGSRPHPRKVLIVQRVKPHNLL